MAHTGCSDLPDLVLTPTSGAIVEAGNPPAFKRLIIDTGLTRETWVRGFDFKPGDARVTRAAFFSVAGTNDYLGGWTPWQSSTELPKGVAFKLPSRARIAVDVLYAGSAKTVTDRPTLGLYVVPSAPAGAVSTSVLRPRKVSRGGVSGVRVAAELTIPASRALVSIRPDMQTGRTVARAETRASGRLARGSALGEELPSGLADTICLPTAGGAARGFPAPGNGLLRHATANVYERGVHDCGESLC
jgi:hypothetical protein